MVVGALLQKVHIRVRAKGVGGPPSYLEPFESSPYR